MFVLATLNDLPEIVAIYNQTIPSRMATADTEPVSVEQRKEWFMSHSASRPIFVYKEQEKVLAWMSFKSFYGRPAYDGTIEIAIYISEAARGKGLGKQLLAFGIEQAKQRSIDTILAFVFSHNEPSLRLFEKAGFSTWGMLPNVAKMDGQSFGLTILGKSLIA